MPTRRAFLESGLAAALLPRVSALPRKRPADVDLVLRGGAVLDGRGAAAVEADVAITGDRIVRIGRRLAERGAEEIDARGLAVAPGFVDIHSHGDGSLDEDPRAESVIRQGVTTIIVGQDGSSRDPDRVRALVEQSRPAVNVATMVGLGGVRGAVVGSVQRAPTAIELARMVGMVEAALQAGACGVSSGLEYTPGGFASVDELIALARPLAPRGLPYSTHLRNEDDRLLESLEEAVAVARGAGCGLQVSHLKAQGPRNWSKLGDALALLERAAAGGTNTGFDVYPYVAYQTSLTNLFPLWSREGGFAAFQTRLADAGTGPRIRAETLAKVELLGGWNNVMISGAPEDREAEGARVGDLAGTRGADPYRLVVDLLARSGGRVGMVGFAMSEANVERALAHPRAIVCSDGGAFAVEGPARVGHPHPRSLGTFPRVLGRYVRERRTLSLEDAVRKMTSRPAARVRLGDRGVLEPGAAADLVVFDPASVVDHATFEEPFQYPAGIPLVIVNGRITLRDGERLDRAGRALRPA
jgi:N-acyl-D-amino-acid deacylase